jgi:cytochrome P450
MNTTKRTTTQAGIIPGPRPAPFLGQPLAVLHFLRDPITLMRHHYHYYGRLSGITAFEPAKGGLLLALGPEYNRQVLNNPMLFYRTHPEIKDKAPARLVSGLINMNGERHRQHRRLIMPAFHRQAVLGYHSDMITLTDAMLTNWCIGQQLDVVQELRLLTRQIVIKTLFGLEDVKTQTRLGSLIEQWTQQLGAPATWLLPHRRGRFARLSEQVETEFKALIAHKRAMQAIQTDVLSTLIHTHDEDGATLSDSELIGHIALLFVAGYETTVNALVWTLLLLSRHPRVAASVIDELAGLLHGDAPSPDDLGKLTLLDCVIKESMRVLPPAVYTMRYATDSFEMGGYVFAKNQGVLLSYFITHRLPEPYPEPERFIPQRWETLEPSPYEYLPFSAGPRMCVGATFAAHEIRVVLAMLLQRFQLSPVASAKVDYQVSDIILRPKRSFLWDVQPPQQTVLIRSLSGTIRQLVMLD